MAKGFCKHDEVKDLEVGRLSGLIKGTHITTRILIRGRQEGQSGVDVMGAGVLKDLRKGP